MHQHARLRQRQLDRRLTTPHPVQHEIGLTGVGLQEGKRASSASATLAISAVDGRRQVGPVPKRGQPGHGGGLLKRCSVV
ncbi:MAG: hypothetical protein IPO15_03050 [Anaerolineae bacterium]|uniref:hypothetical protein n=1 Tax=Candidatus Amarolinea dominans TaxID=3140696 RepID=UPI0031348640|nr:hypothetical protein [Anaerolineae bacterium]